MQKMAQLLLYKSGSDKHDERRTESWTLSEKSRSHADVLCEARIA